MGEITATETWRTALTAWETYMRAAGRPPTTIYLRTYQVRRLAAEHPRLGPWTITFDDLVTWLGRHDWAIETRRAYRASTRAFYTWATLAGHIDASPAALLPPISPPRGRPRPAPERALTEALAHATTRERLMVMLGAYAGLRRAEIARVHSRDLVEDLHDGWSLRVAGKGGHVRVVPLNGVLAAELRKLPAGWAFPSPEGGPLTPAHVGKLIARRLPGGWTTHTLRHRFATVLRAREVQLDVIQELLGHARMETTRIYSEVPAQALRAAVLTVA